MKRLLGLLLVSTLVLSACGNDENQEESKKEVKSKEKKIEKEKENKSKKDKEKEVATQQQPDNQTVEQPQSQEQSVQPQQQIPQNSVPQQNVQVQQNKKQKVDLNNMPPTDFSTEGMSEQAQKQIEELSMQKDYHGLSQREYNDRVSEIINNDN
ncbi:TPA: hypothetical protein KEO01_002457 [Staphylococcus aureus]|nr:hypothetical protein [Staphylococcus aureus]HBC4190027.1 hypothetical protein [Staphylococcus aureus]HDF8448003.1 hypothetical protein [Staphylococcus aureus]HDF8800992.1 hypothetical protein [Staphylococcus aureus]HDF8803659.1 hypothetical protein [Staphylococcus aureus]